MIDDPYVTTDESYRIIALENQVESLTERVSCAEGREMMLKSQLQQANDNIGKITENMEIMTEAMQKMGDNIEGNHGRLVAIESRDTECVFGAPE